MELKKYYGMAEMDSLCFFLWKGESGADVWDLSGSEECRKDDPWHSGEIIGRGWMDEGNESGISSDWVCSGAVSHPVRGTGWLIEIF